MKITIYDLIGLVKDGKQPKKIKYSSCIMIYDVDENDYRTPEKDYYDADVKTYKYLTDCIDLFTDLNDKVEIIEETNKIEKIDFGTLNTQKEKNREFKRAINELIDEINNLKEK
ncbi:MAG: hypothetical protein ACI31R_01600 [Bacilli bacterium]